MSKLQRIRFGEFLTLKNVISEGQLLSALGEHRRQKEPIGKSIVRLGFASPAQINMYAKEFHSIEVVEARHH